MSTYNDDNFNEDYFGPGNDYEEQAAYDELENLKLTTAIDSIASSIPPSIQNPAGCK